MTILRRVSRTRSPLAQATVTSCPSDRRQTARFDAPFVLENVPQLFASLPRGRFSFREVHERGGRSAPRAAVKGMTKMPIDQKSKIRKGMFLNVYARS